jgi:hypothetical protein
MVRGGDLVNPRILKVAMLMAKEDKAVQMVG